MVEDDLEELNFHKWLLQSHRGLLSSQTALSLSLMLWWEWHWNIDDNYHDGCGLQYSPPRLLWEMIDAAFKPKPQSNFILIKRKTSKSKETEVPLHISELIIDEFHNQQSFLRCFTYTVKCTVHIGYTVLPQEINGCLNRLQAQHNKCSVISWMTPQPLLFCQNWRHWHHVQCLSLFSHDVASPNVMYFPQQDTCNLGDSSAGSA